MWHVISVDWTVCKRGENKGNHRLIEIDYLFVFIFLNSNYNIYLVAAFKFTFDLILYKFSREITIFFWYFFIHFFHILSIPHPFHNWVNKRFCDVIGFGNADGWWWWTGDVAGLAAKWYSMKHIVRKYYEPLKCENLESKEIAIT